MSISGPPLPPVTMTTAVDGDGGWGGARSGACGACRQVLLGFAHRPGDRLAGWELREHLRNRATVSHVSCNFALSHSDFN